MLIAKDDYCPYCNTIRPTYGLAKGIHRCAVCNNEYFRCGNCGSTQYETRDGIRTCSGCGRFIDDKKRPMLY